MNNSKIVSTKTTSAIFLAIVLVVGTFALSSPSFMTNVQAQAYYGMDSYDDMKSYGMDDSYGPTDYVMDNDRKSYDNSYYKSQYSSYDKHDRDKSKKDSKKSVSINKLNCINTNLNINGNNAGDISIGNKGQGYLGVSSSDGGGGYGGGYDGHNKKNDKGFDCIINNNNNNTNILSGGGGNVTNGNITDTCEDCFSNLTTTQINTLLTVYRTTGSPTVTSIETLCDLLSSTPNIPTETTRLINNLIEVAGVESTTVNQIIRCLADLGVIVLP